MRSLILCLFASLVASCHQSTTPPDNGPDTTSHNVVWEIEKFGDGPSNYLMDVALVNDTLIYVGGSLSFTDSTGQLDPVEYNLGVWNGSSWRFQRLYYDYQGQKYIQPIRCIYAAGANDIWFWSTGLIHWDGEKFVEWEIPPSLWHSWANKIWESPTGELYVAGDSGAIAHYSNGSWDLLITPTVLDVRDISGSGNKQAADLEVLAVAGNPYTSSDRALFRLTGAKVSNLDTKGITGALTGIWFSPGGRYYAVGAGIYVKGQLSDTVWSKETGLTPNFTEAVRGTAENNVFVVGDFGEVLHYNGQTWKSYLSQTGLARGAYYALSIDRKTVVAVGDDTHQAVILRGRQQ